MLHPDGVAREQGDAIVVDDASEGPEGLAERLTADGVAYVRLARRSAAFVEAAGLEAGPKLLELGDLLVPAEPAALRWALRTRPPSRRAALAGRLPPRVAATAARGVIARRAGARPLAAWLAGEQEADVVVASGRALLVEEGGVSLAARVEAPPGRRVVAEQTALAELGDAARDAGAAVPAPSDGFAIPGAAVLVTRGLPGTPASELLARRPRRPHTLVDRVAAWLERWNTATANERPLSAELLEKRLLAPARRLGLEPGHMAALEQLAAEAAGRRVRLVAAHNDLTTANVLVAAGRPLGIVDWESAEREGLPLTDMFYFVADADAAAARFADRRAAFLASLDRQVALESRLARALELEPLVADVCFHACWLHHAANEQASSPAGATPFLEIVRTIGARRLRLSEAA